MERKIREPQPTPRLEGVIFSFAGRAAHEAGLPLMRTFLAQHDGSRDG